MSLKFSDGSEEMSVVECDPEYHHLCQICYMEQIDILLLPCRHAKMCRSCVEDIVVTQRRPCPRCNQPVTEIVKYIFKKLLITVFKSTNLLRLIHI